MELPCGKHPCEKYPCGVSSALLDMSSLLSFSFLLLLRPLHRPLGPCSSSNLPFSFPDNEGDKSPTSPLHIFRRRNSGPTEGFRSLQEQQNRGLTKRPASPPGAFLDPPSTDAESNGEKLQEPLLGEESPVSQPFELESEALPEDTTPSPEERDISRKKSEDSLPTILENGAAVVTSTSFNGRVSSHTWQDASPPSKRFRKEKKQLESGPLENR